MARLIVHLVHGTQFYLWRKPAIPWVEDDVRGAADGTSFRSGLRRCLESQHHQVEIDSIPWSGRNRHGARRAAAESIRERVMSDTTGARHVLVAHSHGGNACLLALKKEDREFEARLEGIACLATPFLVVRQQAWARTATVSWMIVVMFGILAWLYSHTSWFLLWAPLSGMLVLLPILPLVIRYGRVSLWEQAPRVRSVPLLLVRCPGDEAGSSFGLVEILGGIIYSLEHLAAWPIRMLDRHPWKLWMGSSAVVLGLAVAAAMSPGVMDWFTANWPWVAAVLVGPLLVGLPLRVLFYGLAYGMDLFGLPLVCSVSAEAVPLAGPWTIWLVDPGSAEDRRRAHSEVYELAKVHEIVADWIHERVNGVPASSMSLPAQAPS